MNMRELSKQILEQEAILREGGGTAGKERQKRLKRLTVRERLEKLLDNPTEFLELGLWAAYGMYASGANFPRQAL